MTTAVNTPHTITNALMIWFSSETDIVSGPRDQTDAARSLTTPASRATGVATLKRTRRVKGVKKHMRNGIERHKT